MLGKKPPQSEVADYTPNKVERFSLTSLPLGFNVSGVSSITEAAKLLGRRGGLSRSHAKVDAAKKNGKKGGRPRKKAS